MFGIFQSFSRKLSAADQVPSRRGSTQMTERVIDAGEVPSPSQENPHPQPALTTSGSEAGEEPSSANNGSIMNVSIKSNKVASDPPRRAVDSPRRQVIQTRSDPKGETKNAAARNEAPNPSHGKRPDKSKRTELESQQPLSVLEQMHGSQENMRHQYSMLSRKLKERDAQIQELSERIHANAKQYDELQQAHLYLQQKLGKIQERAFRSMNRNGSVPYGDEEAREDMFRLQKKVTAWAKKNTISGNQRMADLSIDQKREILADLSGYCLHREWEQLIQTVAPGTAERIPVLLIQALMSKIIFSNLFDNAFFIIEAQNQPDLPTSLQFWNFYQAMIKTNETEAHIWRAQLLRMLQTPEEAPRQGSLHAKGLKDAFTRIGYQLTEHFLRGSARYLLSESSDESVLQLKKQLEVIFSYAAQLALSLWTQKSTMASLTLPQIPQFFTGREEMRAHPLHRLDEDETRLDGREVVLVVQPALIAFGNDDAEHYDQHKVWAQAIVLVDERP